MIIPSHLLLLEKSGWDKISGILPCRKHTTTAGVRITKSICFKETFTEPTYFTADRYTVPGIKARQAENNCGLRSFRILFG